jgi:hypothetical protein
MVAGGLLVQGLLENEGEAGLKVGADVAVGK